MSGNESVWFPKEEYRQQTRMYQWMNRVGLTNYDAFFQKSIDDTSWFWGEAVKELGILWSTPYQKTLDLTNGVKYPRWFTGGKMNIYTNAVEKWANNEKTMKNKAVIWVGDDGSEHTLTFEELMIEVENTPAGLLASGVKRGDVIALYLPMIPETVTAILAIAKIGAIFSPAFSGYGAEAVATRIDASQAKFLITADGFFRRGKVVNMKKESDRAVSLSPTIEKVFVIRRTGQDIPWTYGRDIEWSDILKNESPSKTIETNGDDPVMLIYTSGTTGKPKGAVHTHAGFPIKAAFDAGICMDVKPGDTFFWYTDMGWMMGPFLIFGGLVNGAAILLFEGTPDYPNPDRIWKITADHSVTHLGISPTLVRSLMKYGSSSADSYNLENLRVIGSSGEPWNPEPWMWLFETIGKKRIPIVNYSGGTEISGGILGNVLVKPISPITFNSPLPGMDAHVYNEQAGSVINQVGELVIRKPWVGMTNGFWNENERYEDTYWSRWPDTWVHGDWAIKDEQGFWTITGRSDDILNVAGKRLGPSELESILAAHEDVLESAVIGVPDQVKGETAVCFVVLQDKAVFTPTLKKELYETIERQLGKALIPSKIYQISELPKTRNGKVIRRVIKAAFLQKDLGDLSSIENPSSLNQIKTLHNTTLVENKKD